MSRFTFEGRVKLIAIPFDPQSPIDIESPTVSQITGGVEFTVYLPTAGVGINHGQNMASLPMIDKGQVATSPGTQTAEGTLTFVIDDDFPANNPYDYFADGDEMYLVRSIHGWTGAEGAPAAGDKCAVYRATSGDPQLHTPAQDEFAQFDVPFGFENWSTKAVVST